MDMVERVARAICISQGLDPDRKYTSARQGPETEPHEYQWHSYLPEARAAISAMLEGLEPVAWRYENDDRTHNPVTVINVTRWRGHAGWTETPLYDLSALKEVVG